MTKDIEWLKGRFRGRKIFKPQNDREIGYNMAIDEFSEYVDQLDEPEVLSQEWIRERIIWNESTEEEYVYADELQNVIVPKQELPVIPIFVAYVIEAYKSNSRLTNLLADLAFHGGLAEFVDHEDEDEVFEWARSNRKATDEILARAWLDGYTVEEEQKYYAKIKGHELFNDSEEGYWNVDRKELYVDNIWHDYSGYKTTILTKDEWENLGINDDNADFIEVEELEE